MKKSAIFFIMLISLSILISCNQKDKSVETNQFDFFSLPVWEIILPLMEETEQAVSNSNWEELLTISSEISSEFSNLRETINTIETIPEDYKSILNLQTQAWKTVSEVFSNDLSNINNLLFIDKNMTSTKANIQIYKDNLSPGYFSDLSKNNESSEYLLNWGSRLINIIQNKILTGKVVETEEDIEAIKLIIEKAVNDNQLKELQTYLETEAKKDNVPPSILFSLSLVYGRKGLVKEEYKAIEKLEEKVKQSPSIAFNLSLVYGRKETLKSQIDKAEAEALALLQGFISVTSEPSDAEVFIDGEFKGTTPFTTEGLEEGSYSVEIRKGDYTTVNQTASVKAGETTEIVEELELMPGSLTIDSTPKGSKVFLDGNEMGTTPLSIPEIDAGEYKLTVQKENYNDKTISIIIESGKNKILNQKLYHFKGNLHISNLPESPIIIFDGKQIFLSNNRNPSFDIINDIDTGTHTLTIKKEGYADKTALVIINRNESTIINGILDANIFHIPFADINIDGGKEDWDNIEPFFTDPAGDSTADFTGTDIIAGYIAKNDKYLFIRMDFAEGKPPGGKDLVYQLMLMVNSYDSEVLELRLQPDGINYKGRMFMGRTLLIDDMRFKIQDNFFEARYTLSKIPDKYIESETIIGLMHCWRREPRIYYDQGKEQVLSF
ncbi:MAG: PEGA domain-containing protein [Spirochaetia bacterium]|jgi:hypothetical protein|nr:PEGA domain-containing protein [Spirochaetia bacterium]